MEIIIVSLRETTHIRWNLTHSESYPLLSERVIYLMANIRMLGVGAFAPDTTFYIEYCKLRSLKNLLNGPPPVMEEWNFEVTNVKDQS